MSDAQPTSEERLRAALRHRFECRTPGAMCPECDAAFELAMAEPAPAQSVPDEDVRQRLADAFLHVMAVVEQYGYDRTVPMQEYYVTEFTALLAEREAAAALQGREEGYADGYKAGREMSDD